MTIFTNENLYVNSKLKILQIDISTQLTKKIWGIQYMEYVLVQETFPLHIPQYIPLQ